MPVLRLDKVGGGEVRLVKFAKEDEPREKTEELVAWKFETETDANTAIDMAREYNRHFKRLTKEGKKGG